MTRSLEDLKRRITLILFSNCMHINNHVISMIFFFSLFLSNISFYLFIKYHNMLLQWLSYLQFSLFLFCLNISFLFFYSYNIRSIISTFLFIYFFVINCVLIYELWIFWINSLNRNEKDSSYFILCHFVWLVMNNYLFCCWPLKWIGFQ